jgi:hypothetical protein
VFCADFTTTLDIFPIRIMMAFIVEVKFRISLAVDATTTEDIVTAYLATDHQ